ncbi:MAG: hypothetical protein AAFU60_13180 [Bacteroidota bacterium]
MKDQIAFPRLIWFTNVWLFGGIVLLAIEVTRLINEEPMRLPGILAGVLFILNYIWYQRTPFALFEGPQLRLNFGIFNRKKVNLQQAEDVQIKDDRVVEIYPKEGKRILVLLANLNAKDRNSFVQEVRKRTR